MIIINKMQEDKKKYEQAINPEPVVVKPKVKSPKNRVERSLVTEVTIPNNKK